MIARVLNHQQYASLPPPKVRGHLCRAAIDVLVPKGGEELRHKTSILGINEFFHGLYMFIFGATNVFACSMYLYGDVEVCPYILWMLFASKRWYRWHTQPMTGLLNESNQVMNNPSAMDIGTEGGFGRVKHHNLEWLKSMDQTSQGPG